MYKVSTRCILILVFALCIVFQLPATAEYNDLTAKQYGEAIELLGEYHGLRMDKHFSQAGKQYQIKIAEHFRLIHAGKTTEATELYNKEIKPLLKDMEELPRCRFNFYTSGRGVLRMQFNIDPILPAEAKTGGHYAGQAWVDLSLEEFVQLFAGSPMDQIVIKQHHHLYKRVTATTSVDGDKRLISIRLQDFSDEEQNKLTHDDELKIEIIKGSIANIQVFRSKRHLFKVKRYMWAKMDMVKKSAQGLEAGKSGRLATRRFIERALSEENDQNFSSLVKEESALRHDW